MDIRDITIFEAAPLQQAVLVPLRDETTTIAGEPLDVTRSVVRRLSQLLPRFRMNIRFASARISFMLVDRIPSGEKWPAYVEELRWPDGVRCQSSQISRIGTGH